MKKLAFDSSNWKLIGTINDLIDLVNSQQEAIERLQEHVDHEARHVSEPADDKPRISFSDEIVPAFSEEVMEELERRDTHRTVTLRIPKGMTIGKAIWSTLDQRDENCLYRLFEQSDTDLQKALDEVKGESNE